MPGYLRIRKMAALTGLTGSTEFITLMEQLEKIRESAPGMLDVIVNAYGLPKDISDPLYLPRPIHGYKRLIYGEDIIIDCAELQRRSLIEPAD
jgi:hypothetical protein